MGSPARSSCEDALRSQRGAFSYVAYGLGIRSVLPLPELVTGRGGADVAVRLKSGKGLGMVTPTSDPCVGATPDAAELFWPGVAAVLVREGREITIDPATGLEERTLRLFVLGPAMAVLLHQRGRLVLHGSAVAVAGRAVVFLGGPGWGKSTLAAALYARGHGILADDVTAVEADAGSPLVFPGFPQLRLWPEAAAALGDSPETFPRVHPMLEKRTRPAGRAFPEEPLPLERIYVLDKGPAHAIEPLRPQEALVELVRHSYCTRLLQAQGARRHFLQCASLANRVPVCRLTGERSLSVLPDLADLVENDLSRPIA